MAFGSGNDTRAVISDLAQFNHRSGSILERAIFNNRLPIVTVCVLLTIFLGFQALHIKVNANFEGTIPTSDPFMVNYESHKNVLQSSGNSLRISVEADNGTIASAHYLATLQHLTTQVLDLPGVNRPETTSLWTPTTRWLTANQLGVVDGAVVGDDYAGSPSDVSTVMQNILKTGRVGELVGTDFKSSMIYAPLMDHNGDTGGPIDYGVLAKDLVTLKTQYAKQGVTLHIIGFAMIVGDMILGIHKILGFFALSAAIAGAMLFWFTRSVRSTLLVLSCTSVAVTWQLGLLPLMDYALDPYSVLVPFLIFAIGMSHGAQKMNGVSQDIGRGTHRLIAARYTFQRLFAAGFTALICDAIGFGVLSLIKIQEIRELAVIASCGVAILIFTNLILLPILFSYVGVSKKAALRSLRAEDHESASVLWHYLAMFTRRRWAVPTLGVALVLGAVGFTVGRHAQIGNVNDGAPELRANSTYNQDVRYIQNHYIVSDDTLVVLVDSPPAECTNFDELASIDNLIWRLDQMKEVQSASAVSGIMSYITQLMTDNSPKWNQLVENQTLINAFVPALPLGYCSLDGSFAPVNVSLYDLKAAPLKKVVGAIQRYINNPENQGPNFKMSLAGGNAGIAAATDNVIEQANAHILLWIYLAVTVLCYITFRSWRAVICAILPLILTSMLCQALMVVLHIGITVATLPVVALGVGIGVDYALYMLGVMLTHLRGGIALEEAYQRSLRFTGRVVMLTGFTLAVGVGTWVFAPIKFQADMGVLLGFMFLWNMVGALVILPALASFLLKPAIIPPCATGVSWTGDGQISQQSSHSPARSYVPQG